MKVILSLLVLVSLTSCYRMPQQDEFSVCPLTNNRELTRDCNASPIPTVNY